MFAANQFFCTPYFHVREISSHAPLSAADFARQNVRATGLNHYVDAVVTSNTTRPTKQNLTISDPEEFSEAVREFYKVDYKALQDTKPRRVKNASPSELAKWQLEDAAYHSHLWGYLRHLESQRARLEMNVFHDSLVFRTPEGKEHVEHMDGAGKVVHSDAIKAIENCIRQVEEELGTNPTRLRLIQEMQKKAEDELAERTNASPEKPKSTTWSTKKIIGVTALGLSAASALALMVYMYETHQGKPEAVVYPYQPQRQLVANYGQPQPQSLGGYMNYGVQPAMNPAALGYNPNTSGGALLGGTFTPNPLYSYPV